MLTACSSAAVSRGKRFTATTALSPNASTILRCAARFAAPRSSACRPPHSSPPARFIAFVVATSTTAAGKISPARQTMCISFSKPRSDPNPASVTTRSASFKPRRSAASELLPWAMLANGPQWTMAGLPSSVWTRFGLAASRSRTAIVPATSSCSAVTGSPPTFSATVIAPSRRRRSWRSRPDASSAITSEAAVMSNPVSRGNGRSSPTPIEIRRRRRSSMSRHRRHVIVAGSIRSSFPCTRCASTADARRLFAAAIACKSPVKWRLMSSIGTTCARPPPVPPPLAPRTGPTDGSRKQASERSPILASPSLSATAVVVLPSPDFVGVMAVTATSFPSGRPASEPSRSRPSLALCLPYNSKSSRPSPRSAATAVISLGSRRRGVRGTVAATCRRCLRPTPGHPGTR